MLSPVGSRIMLSIGTESVDLE